MELFWNGSGGIDGKELDMTMLQFNAFVRLNYNVGDKIVFNISRDGKRMDVAMTLVGAGFLRWRLCPTRS